MVEPSILSLLSIWWVWVCIAIAFGIIEVLAPTEIFLGFAVGAGIMAILTALFTFTSTSMILAIFGGLSLLAWIILRVAFRRQTSGARIVTRDINDD